MRHDPPNPPESSDPLDTLLRESDAYIPDNGFTARVLTSLPARGKHSWRRFAVLSIALFVGALLLVWQLPSAPSIVSALPKQWSDFHWQLLVACVPLIAALVSLGWAVFAVTQEEE
jgi:hypothetical protein